VIQSWLRCSRQHGDTQRRVAFDPVTPSRLHATLGRNRELLDAACGELAAMEDALAGTDCRVLLTDRDGVMLYASPRAAGAHQPVLRSTARVGINISEQVVGTTAPGIVASTGQACTVIGAEHYFDLLCEMQCAAAPIRGIDGALAGVLDLTLEATRFSFDAASVVGLHATAIENRLLQTQSREHLILRFQACASLLGTPLEALAGVAADGTVAWLNGAGRRLVGQLPDDSGARGVECVLGHDLASLLRLGRRDAAQPLRLASGLGVWMQAALSAPDGVDFRHAVGTAGEAGSDAAAPDACPADALPPASAVPAAAARASLREHSRQLIEETLAGYGGNVSKAARQLRVSRGTLYRRLREWQQAPAD